MRSLRRHVLWNGTQSRPMSSSTMLAVRMARVSTEEYLADCYKNARCEAGGRAGVHAVESETAVL